MKAAVGGVVTLPVLALAALSIHTAWTQARRHERWPPVAVTMPEAVATRDAGEVARQLALGGNPREPAPVRRGLLGDRARTVSALEASVLRGDVQMWRLLRRSDVPLDDAAIDQLRCLEPDAPAPDMHAALLALTPRPWPVCAPR